MATSAFVYQAAPVRVVFGSGTVAGVGEEVARLGLRRVLVLSTPDQKAEAQRIAAIIGEAARAIFAGATMHTPVEVTEEAMSLVEAQAIDGTVAIGGGSTTGLGKAIAYRTDLPQIVLPTTYAGSESTDILGETAAGKKTTVRDPKIKPEVVIYDVDLTLSLPPFLSVTSGLNAIAHAVEGLYAKDANPVLSLMAEEGIRALATALPVIKWNETDVDARSDALYGAWLCSMVLAGTTMALHHKLCHVLGGSFDLPHAETHAVMLRYVAAYNAPAVPAAMQRVSRALGTSDAVDGLFALAETTRAPQSLYALGMAEDDLDRAADLASENPYWNPRPFDRAAIRRLLDDAWRGIRQERMANSE
jgi:maleylacetate reductase